MNIISKNKDFILYKQQKSNLFFNIVVRFDHTVQQVNSFSNCINSILRQSFKQYKIFVIITDEKIITVPFYDLVVADNQVTLSYEYNLSSPSTIFRWRGLSIQPGQHHYMFYSNPIKVGYSQ